MEWIRNMGVDDAIIDLLQRFGQDLGDVAGTLARMQTVMHQKQQHISSPASKFPKDWGKMTGEPSKVMAEYQLFEQQAERARPKTWFEYYEMFEDVIVKDSRLERLVRLWKNKDDFKAIFNTARLYNVDSLYFVIYYRIRQDVWLSAGLDFNQPKKDAQKRWESLTFLGDNLSWTSIDTTVASEEVR